MYKIWCSLNIWTEYNKHTRQKDLRCVPSMFSLIMVTHYEHTPTWRVENVTIIIKTGWDPSMFLLIMVTSVWNNALTDSFSLYCFLCYIWRVIEWKLHTYLAKTLYLIIIFHDHQASSTSPWDGLKLKQHCLMSGSALLLNIPKFWQVLFYLEIKLAPTPHPSSRFEYDDTHGKFTNSYNLYGCIYGITAQHPKKCGEFL